MLRNSLLLLTLPVIVLCSCKKEHPVSPGISPSDIVGLWEVFYVSGTEHPSVGTTFEFTEDQIMIGRDQSGAVEEESRSYWYFLTWENGAPMILLESAHAPGREFAPIMDQVEMLLALELEGDEMRWNVLTRDDPEPAKPPGETVYKFRRK